MTREERLKLFQSVSVYPVTCERLSRGRTDIDVLNGVIAGGAKIIQLREKNLSKRAFYELSLKFKEITNKHNVLLIINDHVDIALACGADGVHLGQNDLPIHAAKRIAPDIIIGASTHRVEEALTAQEEGADYVNIGPVFTTLTKEVSAFLGVEKVKAISEKLRIPFTVMGGITLENVAELVRIGAKKIALVSAITTSEDIAAKTRAFIKKIEGE